ncbi:MAG TPA: hypothetical protein VHM92_09255 [Allosphingosinicella sp.]|nr:hypothetical protein [Allosphingosinicella sp.]
MVQRKPEAHNWMRRALEAVEALDHDWDGYGADPISSSVIAQMRNVLENLLPTYAAVGSIVPGADGSLQAEWHLDDVELGLVVERDGDLSSWVRRPHGDLEIERSGIDGWDLFRSVAQTALA